MIIVLNDKLELKLQPERAVERQQEYVDRIHSSLNAKARSVLQMPEIRWNKPVEGGELVAVRPLPSREALYQNGLMGIASSAYSQHYGLEIAPHDIWYIMLTQLAEMINEHPEHYRSLFTKSDEKQLILVDQDHPTDINVHALIEKMKPCLPVDADLFFPELSTHTSGSRLACAAAFADAMRAYYDYGMFCCGIPRIRLTGTLQDWRTMMDHAEQLKGVFAPVTIGLRPVKYLEKVQEVLGDIILSFVDDNQNQSFWQDIFTQRNIGSGGDLEVNGWLTKLYAKSKPGDMIKAFHHTISALPYTNVSTKERFIMLHGAFYANVTVGDILQAQYDHVTFQVRQ